jgi:CheY-like chemotaxis protein
LSSTSTSAAAILNCSILIASGERDQGRLDWTALGRHGYRLLHARDAAAAMHLYAAEAEIAVVIVDLETIGDGLALIEKLQALDDGRDWTEYLAIAGDDRIAAGAIRLHLSDLLVKPVSGERLLAPVSDAYNVSRLRRFRREESQALDAALAEFRMRMSAAASQLVARARTPGPAAIAVPDADWDGLQAFITEELERAQARDRVFGPLAQHHPTWMLLLVLSDALLAGMEPTIKSAAYAAGLPLSSALRKINEMCAGGLIARRGDPEDARRSFISLTPQGQAYFGRYLAEWNRGRAQSGGKSVRPAASAR